MVLDGIDFKNDKYGKVSADSRLISNRIPAREKSLENIFANYSRMKSASDEKINVVDIPVDEEIISSDAINYDGSKVFARLDDKINIKDRAGAKTFVKDRPIVIKKLMSDNLFNNSAYIYSRNNADKVDETLFVEDIAKANEEQINDSISAEVSKSEDYQIDVEQLEKDINAYLQSLKNLEEKEEIKVVEDSVKAEEENRVETTEDSQTFIDSKSLDDIMEAIYRIPQNMYLSNSPKKVENDEVIRDDIVVVPDKDEVNEIVEVDSKELVQGEVNRFEEAIEYGSDMDKAKLIEMKSKLSQLREDKKAAEAARVAAEKNQVEENEKAAEARKTLISVKENYRLRTNLIEQLCNGLEQDIDNINRLAQVAREDAECNNRFIKSQEREIEGYNAMVKEIDMMLGNDDEPINPVQVIK